MKWNRAGFTLIELLVAMAIFSILFVIISSITNSMSRSSQVLNSKSQLTQEGQTVQRLLAGRISEAIYIYPAATTLQLTASGATTENTIRSGAGQSWTVNTDPFIAMILPPRAPTYNAGSNVPNNCATDPSNGCYRFYAYYPVKRSKLTGAVKTATNPTGLEPSSVPSQDDLNSDAWVLMQYQANLTWTPGYTASAQGITAAQIGAIGTTYRGNAGIVLADYIQPQTADNGSNDLFPAGSTPDPAIDNCLMFCVTKSPSTTPARANDGTVDIRFRMQQNSRGLSEPILVTGTDPTDPTAGSNSYIGGVVSPRNWWPTAP